MERPGERTPGERIRESLSGARLRGHPAHEQAGFGPDVAFSEVPQQFVDTAKFEVSPED